MAISATDFNALNIFVMMDETPFYASDLRMGFPSISLSGSDVAALHREGFIKPTGNTREETIEVGYYYTQKITVTTKEWVCNPLKFSDYSNTFEREVEEAKKFIKAAYLLGIVSED